MTEAKPLTDEAIVAKASWLRSYLYTSDDPLVPEANSCLTVAEAKSVLDALISACTRITALRATQRTPGTVEICENYRSPRCADNEDYDNMGACGFKKCPLRPAPGAEKGEGA